MFLFISWFLLLHCCVYAFPLPDQSVFDITADSQKPFQNPQTLLSNVKHEDLTEEILSEYIASEIKPEYILDSVSDADLIVSTTSGKIQGQIHESESNKIRKFTG